MRPNPPTNHDAKPAPDGWYLSESTHEYDGQERLTRTQISGSKNQPAPQEDPAWTRGRRTEGAGFVKQIEYQEDEAGRVSKQRVWTNYPPLDPATPATKGHSRARPGRLTRSGTWIDWARGLTTVARLARHCRNVPLQPPPLDSEKKLKPGKRQPQPHWLAFTNAGITVLTITCRAGNLGTFAGEGLQAFARGREPNRLVPIRTRVAPSSIATSKSPLMPMLSCGKGTPNRSSQRFRSPASSRK